MTGLWSFADFCVSATSESCGIYAVLSNIQLKIIRKRIYGTGLTEGKYMEKSICMAV